MRSTRDGWEAHVSTFQEFCTFFSNLKCPCLNFPLILLTLRKWTNLTVLAECQKLKSYDVKKYLSSNINNQAPTFCLTETTINTHMMQDANGKVSCNGCRIFLFISTMINTPCHTCTGTFLFYICSISWFLLIGWKTTMLPLGDISVHLSINHSTWFMGQGLKYIWNVFLRGKRELKRQTNIKTPLLICFFFRLRCSLSGLYWLILSK